MLRPPALSLVTLPQPHASSFGSWNKPGWFRLLSLCTCCSPSCMLFLHGPHDWTPRILQPSTALSFIHYPAMTSEVPPCHRHCGFTKATVRNPADLVSALSELPVQGEETAWKSLTIAQEHDNGGPEALQRPEKGHPSPGKPTHHPRHPRRSTFQLLLSISYTPRANHKYPGF